jgi:hypothetical protein
MDGPDVDVDVDERGRGCGCVSTVGAATPVSTVTSTSTDRPRWVDIFLPTNSHKHTKANENIWLDGACARGAGDLV